MSQEIFEIVKQMNLDNLEVQIALQCAPLISGLRFSNLFNVNNEQADYLISLMNEMHISWKILFRGKEKLTMLLYKKDILENYFSDIRVKNILKNSGYEKNIVDEEDISGLIDTFADRYCCYMQTKKYFPHEMGLFLGYPVEDVEGYLKNNGENSLYTGYWKVYEDVAAKSSLFERFEKANEQIIWFLAQGVSIKNLENIAL